MTREEAITKLHWLKAELIKGTDFNEPLDMAIEALKEKINREHKIMKGTEILARLLDHEDCLEEVVHCKDCKKANTEECPISYWDDDWGKWRISYAGDNWFCADGERRK